MVSVTVVNRKDAVKYLVRIGIAIIIVWIFTRYFCSLKGKNTSNEEVKCENQKVFISCLDDTIPTIKEVNNEENDTEDSVEPLKLALTKEITALNSLIEKENLEDLNLEKVESSISENEVSNVEEKTEIQKAATGVTTGLPSLSRSAVIPPAYPLYEKT